MADLTVRENILHSARIRLGGRLNDDKIRLHVDKMITYLGLFHVKDRVTGSVEKRGISGGERKRVCIAREIIAMPMALISDEPTSGLDATAALSIMTLLKTLSTSPSSARFISPAQTYFAFWTTSSSCTLENRYTWEMWLH